MLLSLTLGTKEMLKKNTNNYILFQPLLSDNAYLRADLDGKEYQEIYSNSFNWKSEYYHFLYLDLSKDQGKLLEQKITTGLITFNNANFLFLKAIKNKKYIIIFPSNTKSINKELVFNQLKVISKKSFGMFSKTYQVTS